MNVPTLNKEAANGAAAAAAVRARNATSAAKLVILLVTALREVAAVEATTVVEEEATVAEEVIVTRPGKSNKVNLPVCLLTLSSPSATLAVELVTCRVTAFRDQNAITATES